MFTNALLFSRMRGKNVGKGDTQNDSDVFNRPVTGDRKVVVRDRELRLKSPIHLTTDSCSKPSATGSLKLEVCQAG